MYAIRSYYEPRHAQHAFVAPTIDADLSDCAKCHPNVALFTPQGGHDDHRVDTSLNLAAGIVDLGGGNYSCATVACHASSAGDGFWTDTAMNCDACHYQADFPSGFDNGNHAHPLSNSHNKHFSYNFV